MEYLLFFAAAAVLLTAGFGAAAVALRERQQVSIGELAALTALLGVLFVTLVSWGVSLVLPGHWAWAVGLASALSLVAGGIGAVSWARKRPRLVGIGPFFLLAVPLTALLAWISATTPFGWDGFFIWQLKAEAIAAEGGAPWSYLHDDSRAWSHPIYPLLVPISRAWFHPWLGEPHEACAKLAGALFFLAAAGLVVALASRLGAATSLVALALLVLTPLEIVGEGSATSGYADFPLAVYYLGALLYVFYALGPAEPGDLCVAGWLAAALPWTKQEGKILFLCFLALALLALGRRGWRNLRLLAAPGVAVLLAWGVFVAASRVETAEVFYDPSLGLLRERLHLWDDIGKVMVRQASDPVLWGLLWALFPVAALIWPRAHRPRQTLFLVLAVVVPLTLYSLPYFFTRWNPVTLHVENSFPRLLLQLSLPAILLIAWKTAALAFPDSMPASPAGGTAPANPQEVT